MGQQRQKLEGVEEGLLPEAVLPGAPRKAGNLLELVGCCSRGYLSWYMGFLQIPK